MKQYVINTTVQAAKVLDVLPADGGGCELVLGRDPHEGLWVPGDWVEFFSPEKRRSRDAGRKKREALIGGYLVRFSDGREIWSTEKAFDYFFTPAQETA